GTRSLLGWAAMIVAVVGTALLARDDVADNRDDHCRPAQQRPRTTETFGWRPEAPDDHPVRRGRDRRWTAHAHENMCSYGTWPLPPRPRTRTGRRPRRTRHRDRHRAGHGARTDLALLLLPVVA